jgi:hypothetical protein
MRKLLLFLFCILATGCGGETGGPTSGGSDKLLVWIGDGPAPHQRVPNTRGQVAYLNPDGTFESLLNISSEAIAVFPCGTEAISPNGRYFSFFVNAPQSGIDNGTLYQITDAGQPLRVSDNVHALSCLGNGSFQYSPDSRRMGYINYGVIRPREEYLMGSLEIRESGSINTLNTFDNIAGFYLANDAVYAVRFFPNNNGEVDEVTLLVWDGNETKSPPAIFPTSGCRFTNAQLAPSTDNRLAVMFGQRCGGSNLSWQFYTINTADQSTTMALNESIGSSFFPYTRTNNVIPAAGGGTMLYTLPDGLTANTVGVYRVDMSTLTPEAVIPRGALMPRYETRAFSLPSNTSAVFSRDGRWWASVVTEAIPKVNIIDISNPAGTVIESPAPTRSATIPFLGFTANGDGLFYLAGGTNGTENTLFKIDLPGGAVRQVSRGTYGPGAVTPDGQLVALAQWLRAEDRRQTPYTNVVSVNVADGSETTLFTGIDLNADGSVANRRFAHPLAWRR